jgi:beta-barrel assembly-enhancing protease
MRALWFVMLLGTLVPRVPGDAQTPVAPPAISDADEIRAGAVLAAKYEAVNGLASTPEIRKIDAYLQKVGDRVALHARRRLPYRFHFDPDPGFKSGFALPGGQIFVGGGILAFIDTEDQLAAVLGHEIEHVDLGQCRDRLVQEMAKRHISAAEWKTLELDPFLPGYGHDREFAADREGVRLAMAAGYSGNAAVRLLETFVILGQQMPNTPSEAKSNLEARAAQIRSLAESQKPLPAEKPLALPQ